MAILSSLRRRSNARKRWPEERSLEILGEAEVAVEVRIAGVVEVEGAAGLRRAIVRTGATRHGGTRARTGRTLRSRRSETERTTSTRILCPLRIRTRTRLLALKGRSVLAQPRPPPARRRQASQTRTHLQSRTRLPWQPTTPKRHHLASTSRNLAAAPSATPVGSRTTPLHRQTFLRTLTPSHQLDFTSQQVPRLLVLHQAVVDCL